LTVNGLFKINLVFLVFFYYIGFLVYSFPDSGSHDEGIHIPKGRGMHSSLAKSLPVNVPVFLPPHKRGSDESEDERVSALLVLKLVLRLGSSDEYF
jgi:hypothetical protein